MPQKYAIRISDRTLDLVQFLNDGHRLQVEEETTYLVCEINGPREITSKVQPEDELYEENGIAKDYLTFLL